MQEIIEADFQLGLCAVCDHRPATQFCDYVMEYHHNINFVRNWNEFKEINRRGEQYETCDLPMCKECAKEIAKDHDLCPHHFCLHKQREIPNPYQQNRRRHAKGYLAGLAIK